MPCLAVRARLDCSRQEGYSPNLCPMHPGSKFRTSSAARRRRLIILAFLQATGFWASAPCMCDVLYSAILKPGIDN